MPQVQPTEITTEESQKQLDAQESLQTNLLDKIKGGDVFKSVTGDLPQAEDHQGEEQQAEEPQVEEQPQEEVQQDEEEVVPKSKIQPRIDQLTARLKAQEAEIQSLKEKSSAPADDTQRKLDAMSEDALEDTLTQIRVAKERARDDDAKLLELVRLERQVEKTIVTAPQRFASNQVNEANKTVQRLASEGEITDANYNKVLEIAKGIYERYPKMQRAVDGQAMAIELAVEHAKALSKVNVTTNTTNNLKAQVNTLKKKTMLDTKQIKSGGERVNLDKLRETAMSGSMKDKQKFFSSDPRIKIDSMIPDYMKG